MIPTKEELAELKHNIDTVKSTIDQLMEQMKIQQQLIDITLPNIAHADSLYNKMITFPEDVSPEDIALLEQKMIMSLRAMMQLVVHE